MPPRLARASMRHAVASDQTLITWEVPIRGPISLARGAGSAPFPPLATPPVIHRGIDDPPSSQQDDAEPRRRVPATTRRGDHRPPGPITPMPGCGQPHTMYTKTSQFGARRWIGHGQVMPSCTAHSSTVDSAESGKTIERAPRLRADQERRARGTPRRPGVLPPGAGRCGLHARAQPVATSTLHPMGHRPCPPTRPKTGVSRRRAVKKAHLGQKQPTSPHASHTGTVPRWA